ncbi:MAG: trigger factor [Campylobacterota bacterium]|nr:trigger factor [Campylobacterota bacterium]
MDIKANKIDDANAEIVATISQDEVSANVEKIAKELTKTASIAGFRKGKVPVSAVKKQYGDRLVQDAEAEALRTLLADALKEMDIDNATLIGEPQITKFDKGEDKIEVEVKVAMRPDINTEGYADMVDAFDKPVISDEDVDTRIKELSEAQAEFIDVEEDRALIEGDTAKIDFEGFVDGEAFDGGKAEGFSLKLGSGQFIPGFEEQVVGMKKDEEKTVAVTFPESYNSEKLAGKPAEFKVKVQGIQTKADLELNDDLAKKMIPGEENADMAMLRNQVKNQLENETLTKLYNEDLKPNLLETFVEKFEFSLPDFVVEQEMDMALNKHAQSMEEAELNALKDDAEKVKELRETFRDDAARSVKATFIIDKLAQNEGITIAEQEVMQTIYFEAMQMGQDPEQAYKHYQESGYLPAIQMAMIEDKVLSKLLNDKIKA